VQQVQLYINQADQVFNLDESGLSLKERDKGRVRVVTLMERRANSVDLKCRGNVDRITIMPLVSADGKPWNPVVVLPGTVARWRKRADGQRIETPADFLPLRS
jgi:hypothetical protein